MRNIRFRTVLAAVVAVSALAGCANTTAVSPTGPGAPVLVSDGEDVYQRLLDDIYGTAADRVIAEKFQHHRIQQAIADCMTGRGLTYTPPVYDGIAGGPIVPGDIDGAAPLAADFAIAATRQRHAEAATRNATINNGPTDPSKQAAYDQALTACANSGAEYQDTHFPPGTNEVGEAILNNLLEIVEIGPYRGLAADYRTCLAKTGYPVGSWAELHATVLAKFPPTGQPWHLIKDTTAWTDAVAYERAAATADRTCRVGLHQHTMSRMGPRAERFYTEGGGGSVREVTTGWDRLLQDAATAGIT